MIVVRRVRHRPGFTLTVTFVAVFLLVLVQYAYVLRLSAGPPPRPSKAQSPSKYSPNTIADSLWPWPAPTKQDKERITDPLRQEADGEDPVDNYPVFRELKKMPDPLYDEFVSWHGEDYEPPLKAPYKPGHSPEERRKKMDKSKDKTTDNNEEDDGEGEPQPIPDPFPLLSQLDKASVQKYLPKQHNTKTRTPLMIGFTRNWPLLLQCVTSYMAAGWPARDIYVVENTGTMGANKAGRLTLQNPFFLNHTQLADTLGVNVIETPTLFTFTQLQNFYLYTAQQMSWPQYFWSHQDVVVFSEKGYVEGGSTPRSGSIRPSYVKAKQSLHHRALATLKILTNQTAAAGSAPRWATHFFNYDRLTLVNVHAYLAVGAWDPHISFYASDCDMYLRLKWEGYWQGMLLPEVGRIFDVAGVLDDLGALFQVPGVRAAVGGYGTKGVNKRLRSGHEDPQKAVEQIDDVVNVVDQMQRAKNEGIEAIADALEPVAYSLGHGELEASDDSDEALAAASAIEVESRNSWQLRQRGGQGEPFYRDPDGFEAGLQMHIATGRKVYADKWGHRGCDLDVMGIVPEDAWQLERDWDLDADGTGSDGRGW